MRLWYCSMMPAAAMESCKLLACIDSIFFIGEQQSTVVPSRKNSQGGCARLSTTSTSLAISASSTLLCSPSSSTRSRSLGFADIDFTNEERRISEQNRI